MTEEEVLLLDMLIEFDKSVDNLTECDYTIAVLKQYLELKRAHDQFQIDRSTEMYVRDKFDSISKDFFDKAEDILV